MKKTNPGLLLFAVFALVSVLEGECGLAQPAGRATGGEGSTAVERIRVGGNVPPFKGEPIEAITRATINFPLP